MNVVIIDGHGFVGKNIQTVLSASSNVDEISCLSRQNGFDLLNEDIDGKQKHTLLDADFIINCAADVGSLNYVTEKAGEIIDINSRINLNLYSIIQKLNAKAVIINPIANCGFPGNLTLYREEDFWSGEIHKSVLAYGTTRRLLTVIAECYQMQFGIQSINYYVPNMYGEFDSIDPNKSHALNALIGKVVKAINENKDVVVWGTGDPIREWLYARDFGRIIYETMIKYQNGEDLSETINVGQKAGVSINFLLDIIIPASGFLGKIIHDLKRQDGAPSKVMDDKIFRKRFPDFQFTDLVEGTINTVKYYQSIYPY